MDAICIDRAAVAGGGAAGDPVGPVVLVPTCGTDPHNTFIMASL